MLHGGLPDHRGAQDASRYGQGGAAPAGHRAARLRRHSGAGAAALVLPAPALGRHEPARDDRHGHCLQSQAADRRRADHRARCHHPGADPRASGEAAEGHRHGPRAHHPLHGRGGRDGRARQRAICRTEGGRAAGEGSLRRSASSLHGGAALGPARARHRRGACPPFPAWCRATSTGPRAVSSRRAAATPRSSATARRRGASAATLCHYPLVKGVPQGHPGKEKAA